MRACAPPRGWPPSRDHGPVRRAHLMESRRPFLVPSVGVPFAAFSNSDVSMSETDSRRARKLLPSFTGGVLAAAAGFLLRSGVRGAAREHVVRGARHTTALHGALRLPNAREGR